MVIPNTHLYEVAKAMNGEAYVIPEYYGFSDSLATVSTADVAMSGEFGSRIAATQSRDNNTVTFSAIRTGALVPTTGETITGVGTFSLSSSGVLMTETVVPEINHTNAFDIEFITTITYTRSS